MENNLVKADALIPRSVVFAKAEELKLSPSDDRFDRFRKAGLLHDLAQLPGTTQHGFTKDQADRFIFLLGLCKVLGRRPKLSALAFWLCWYGANDVPADLICEHVENEIKSYLRYMRREFDRKRVPPKGLRNPQRWERAGDPWAKFILKNMLRRGLDNPIARQVLSWTVGLALRALISPTSFETVASGLRHLMHLIGVDKSKIEAQRQVWAALSEAMPLFTFDINANALVGAMRSIRAEDPSAIIPIVQDTRNMIGAMGAVFPIFRTTWPPQSDDPNDKTKLYIARRFGPAMTAVSVLTRNFPHAIEMRNNMRAGNYEPVIAEFYQVKVVMDDIMTRIGIGAKP
jgi:hypothetical protein